MRGSDIHDEPSETNAEAGVVIVDGPDGVAFSMTPGAAATTSERLRESARRADEQRQGKRPPIG